jgi:hypothetical protein
MTTEHKVAIFCATLIFILELIALYKGTDGIALSIAVAAISGLGGYAVKRCISP